MDPNQQTPPSIPQSESSQPTEQIPDFPQQNPIQTQQVQLSQPEIPNRSTPLLSNKWIWLIFLYLIVFLGSGGYFFLRTKKNEIALQNNQKIQVAPTIPNTYSTPTLELTASNSSIFQSSDDVDKFISKFENNSYIVGALFEEQQKDPKDKTKINIISPKKGDLIYILKSKIRRIDHSSYNPNNPSQVVYETNFPIILYDDNNNRVKIDPDKKEYYIENPIRQIDTYMVNPLTDLFKRLKEGEEAIPGQQGLRKLKPKDGVIISFYINPTSGMVEKILHEYESQSTTANLYTYQYLEEDLDKYLKLSSDYTEVTAP